MSDVKLPISTDLTEFLSQFNELVNAFGKLKQETGDTQKSIEAAFAEAAAGGDKAEQQVLEYVKVTKQQADALDVLNKKLKELEKSKLPTQEAKKYADEIKRLKEEIQKAKDEAKKFGTEASNSNKQASGSMQVLLGVIDAAKQKLATMTEGSKGFNTLKSEIAAAELAMSSMGKETEETGDKMETARKKLKEFQITLQNLKLAGLDNTQVYKDLKNEAGELKDTIGDVQEEIAAVGSDTKGIDNVIRGVQLATNAMGVYEGVVAITGQRNEEFEETMIRLNALLTISNSLQAIMAELKRADNVLTTAQIGLQKVFAIVVGTSTGAMKAFRIALATSGVGLLVLGILELASAFAEEKDATLEAVEAKEKYNEQLREVIEQSEKARNAQKGQLNDLKRELEVLEATNAGESAVYKKRAEIRKAELFNLKVARASYLETDKEYAELTEQIKDKENEVLVEQLELQQKTREKALEKQKQNAQERQKALEERNKRIAELESQLADLTVQAISEGRNREIAEENKSYAEKLAALRENLGVAKGKELELINKNIEQLTINHYTALRAIDLNYYTDAAAAFKQAQESIQETIVEGQEGEEAAVAKKYENLFAIIETASNKLRENIANGVGDTELQQSQFEQLGQQLKALTEKQLKEVNAVRSKYQLESLDQQEKLAVAEIEVLQMSGVDQEKLEEIKEQSKIDVLISFARKRIELLKSIGDEESRLQILQIEKTIQDLSKGKQQKNADSQQDLFSILGLRIDTKTKQDIIAGAKSVFDSITELFAASVQKRIEESERLLEALQDQIDEQEEIVDREKELAEKGYANNLSIEEKKLADLKRQKAEEAAELKKAQAEQQKFAAIQVAINGIVSASNLAVSAANYFKEGSKYGPIAGTILALAAIATMVTTFIAVKKQAQSVAQFRHGGELDMTNQTTSHERGGLELYDGASGKKIAEAQGGEYAYFFKNGKHAKAFRSFFDVINNGGIPAFPEVSLIETPNSQSLAESMPGRDSGRSLAELYELKAQTDILRRIASKEERTVENGYTVIKKGNHIRKIKSN